MEDIGKWVIGVLIIMAIFAGIVFGAMQLSQAQCASKTENIGFPSRWSWIGGCQIEVTDGQWIPLESYYFKQE